MENALIAILLDFAVFQIEINCKSSVFFHDDELSIINGGATLAEKETAGGDAILMVAMPSAIMQKHFLFSTLAKPVIRISPLLLPETVCLSRNSSTLVIKISPSLVVHNRGHLVFNLPMGRHLQPRGECGEIDGMEAIAATDVFHGALQDEALVVLGKV